MITKPKTGEAPAYCNYFISLVESQNLLEELEKSKQKTLHVLYNLPKEKEYFAYAEDKWTSLELIQHIIDCERIFAYRIFRFSRFDQTELSGFDENNYIKNISPLKLIKKEMINDFEAVRNSTIALYKNINDKMLDFKGIANKYTYTARSLGYMAVGHNLHHIDFLEKKYLN